MKSRIQMAGVEHGSSDLVLWKGDLPQLSGMPGMRITLNEGDKSHAYSFRQVTLEVDTVNDYVEQVVYVSAVSKERARELLETAPGSKETE